MMLSLSFNPHTHEGCDTEADKESKSVIVSIHTPTKGVTKGGRGYAPRYAVSIHTPTKGVTALPTEPLTD